MTIMDTLVARAMGKSVRIVFPEGADERIVQAAHELESRDIAQPLVLCDENLTKKSEYAAALTDRTGMPAEILEMMFSDPLNYAAAMVALGDAEGMVAGLSCATQDVIMSAQMIIGLAEGISLPSSFFIMELPVDAAGYELGEDGCLVFADCAVVANPTTSELADIAIATADSVARLLKWQPRVAMLSFSTHTSAVHDDVTKVTEALRKIHTTRPDIVADGEFQADTALVASIAAHKVKGESKVAGCANVLVFPDLDAGNIAYKLVQRLAGAKAYGPVLQGFAKPVSDLSRGATLPDIVGAATLIAAQR